MMERSPRTLRRKSAWHAQTGLCRKRKLSGTPLLVAPLADSTPTMIHLAVARPRSKQTPSRETKSQLMWDSTANARAPLASERAFPKEGLFKELSPRPFKEVSPRVQAPECKNQPIRLGNRLRIKTDGPPGRRLSRSHRFHQHCSSTRPANIAHRHPPTQD